MNEPFLASYLFYDEQGRRPREAAQPPAGDRVSAKPETAAWYRAAFRATRRRGSAA